MNGACLYVLVVLAVLAVLGAVPVNAQDVADVRPAATQLHADTPRLAIGTGPSAVFGAFVEIDGQEQSTEQPGELVLSLLARVEVPVSNRIVLGVQGMFVDWGTDSSEYFGASHQMVDLSALVRYRIRGFTPAHEWLFAVPFGPTFDFYDLGPRRYGSTVHNELGWHVGLVASYQWVPAGAWLGCFGELGFTYHSIPKTLDHGTSREDVFYDVKELFVRGGFMLLPFN